MFLCSGSLELADRRSPTAFVPCPEVGRSLTSCTERSYAASNRQSLATCSRSRSREQKGRLSVLLLWLFVVE